MIPVLPFATPQKHQRGSTLISSFTWQNCRNVVNDTPVTPDLYSIYLVVRGWVVRA